MHDVVIIGSGAAGVAAAMEFVNVGVKPLILDVGIINLEKNEKCNENLYSYRDKNDTFKLFIGERFQGLSKLWNLKTAPIKLTAPNMEFVMKDSENLSPINELNFISIQSFAKGGLGNAWGAGFYRYNDCDLKDFPISENQLSPYFDTLEKEIGMSGTDDDLSQFFGQSKYLQPPLELSYHAKGVYEKYLQKKTVFNDSGIYIGHPRVCVLSENKNGRKKCDYRNLEFWEKLPYIYTPTITLDKLISTGSVHYENRVLVKSWSENINSVIINGIKTTDYNPVKFEAKKLVIAAGTINTTKIVLNSFRDFETKLTLFDNPAIQIPLVLPSSIGRNIDIRAFGLGQLSFIWDQKKFNFLAHGSIAEITSPMRSDFFSYFPFSASSNLVLLRNLLPAMLVMQLFFPASCQLPSLLSLQKNGKLKIEGQPNSIDINNLKVLIKYFRKLGLWTHPKLFVKVPTGLAIHYAGTLPMFEKPKKYQCYPSGKLYGTQNVFIADSASFPSLPAKHISYTLMANSMRVADNVLNELREN